MANDQPRGSKMVGWQLQCVNFLVLAGQLGSKEGFTHGSRPKKVCPTWNRL